MLPLDSAALKRALQFAKTQVEKCVLALARFDQPVLPRQVSVALVEAGLSEAASWPVATRLKSDKHHVVCRRGHYLLSSKGRSWVEELIPNAVPSHASVRSDLRALVARIGDESVRVFVLEAVRAFENSLHRSSVVMSWLAAVHVLQLEVFNRHRSDFDQEMRRRDANWRPLKSVDDFGRLKETEFLDRLTDISVINKAVKAELKTCLDRRNGCGHPNSYQVEGNTVAHHIEVLVVNVFQRFS